MGRLGFYYNMNTCVACGACQMACKKGHHLQPGEFLRRTGIYEYGPFSGGCNHCEEAACIKACPAGAMYKAEDGTTQHDDGKCIACGSCLWSCPYGAVSFSKTRGVAQKCDTCIEKRQQGLEPGCVKACPTNSLKFGDLDEITEGIEVVCDLPCMASSELTSPNIRIKPSDRVKASKVEGEVK